MIAQIVKEIRHRELKNCHHDVDKMIVLQYVEKVCKQEDQDYKIWSRLENWKKHLRSDARFDCLYKLNKIMNEIQLIGVNEYDK